MKAHQGSRLGVFLAFTVGGLLGLALLLRWAQSSDGFGGFLDNVGRAVKQALIPVVHLINAPGFVYTAATIIILSAIILILIYRRRVVVPQMAALRQAEMAIRTLPSSREGDWRVGLSDIGAALARHDVLSSTWPVYVQEAVDAGRLPPRRFAFYVEADPSNQFNRQGSLMAAMPGYYTTVGLILTFVGLVVALYFAARGFRSGDLAEARLSIIELLNASAFKFLSSVAALFSAFMISIAHRIGQSRLRMQNARLLAAIDGYLQTARMAPAPPDAGNLTAGNLDRVVAELAATRTAIEALVAASARGSK